MEVIKMVVLGSSGVGKTALTTRYTQGIFVEIYDPVIDDSRHTINVEGRPYILELLDTSGSQQFLAMRDLYYKGGEGFLVVYSIVAQSTFNDIADTYDYLVNFRMKEGLNTDCVVLVGNKVDLEDQRVISKEAGEQLANSLNCSFLETSAKSNINVQEMVQKLAKLIVQHKHSSVSRQKGGCVFL
uniref:Uncharacterized protein n=1 Tax=Arcella intermedia TaxID=1963864 RepID=A0A6B2LK74_9EUKA